MNTQPSDRQPVNQSGSEAVDQSNQRSKIKNQPCRLSPTMLLNLAQAYAAKGDMAAAEQCVAAAYAENPDLKDGYARCAWTHFWPLKDYAKVIEWMEKDAGDAVGQSVSESVNQSAGQSVDQSVRQNQCPASQITNQKSKIKNHQCRLSPAWAVNYVSALLSAGNNDKAGAVADSIAMEELPDSAHVGYFNILFRLGRRDEAANVVRRIYAVPGNTLRDALSRIAGELNKAGDRPKALELLHEDHRLGRQTPGWTLYLVNWLLDARQPDQAGTVAATLTLDPFTTTPARLHYAVTLARLGQPAAAEQIVRDTYAKDPAAKDPAAKDGLSRIAWILRAAGNTEGALRLLAEDHTSQRQTIGWTINYTNALLEAGQTDAARNIAQSIDPHAIPTPNKPAWFTALIRLGCLAEAESLTRQLYADPDSTLKDGLSRNAGELNKAGKRAAALELLREDFKAGRQTTPWTLTLVNWLLDAKQTAEAQSIFTTIDPNSFSTESTRYNYALIMARLGRLDEAESLMRQAYSGDPSLKNGYARIGWTHYWPLKDYAKVIEWMERDVGEAVGQSVSLSVNQLCATRPDLESGLTHPPPPQRAGVAETGVRNEVPTSGIENQKSTIKDQKCRLSPAWRLNYAKAIARTDGMESAIPFVEDAYEADPGLKNGFAQVAWSRFIPEDMAYEKVLPYFEKDIERGALAGDWQLNYAQALAVMDREEEAERQVEDAYAKCPNLKNGFARCGWLRHFITRFTPEAGLHWFKKDLGADRLSGVFEIHLGSLLAATGDLSAAMRLIKTTYSENSTIANGHAFVGWYYNVVYKNSYDGTCRFFKRDQRLNRLDSRGKMLLAALYAYEGDRKQAERIAEYAYTETSIYAGGYAMIGLCDYIGRQDLSFLHEMFEKDHCKGRLSRPFLMYLHSLIVSELQQKNKAEAIRASAVNCSTLAPLFALSWILRIVPKLDHMSPFNSYKDELFSR